MTTEIEWLAPSDGEAPGETWNPMLGCSHAGMFGCDHCWAAAFASRGLTPAHRGLASHGKWIGAPRFLPERLAAPLHWRKPRKVGVCLMSDLFHEAFSNEQIAAVFGVMAACPQHTFIVPSKRSKRRRQWLEWIGDFDISMTISFAASDAIYKPGDSSDEIDCIDGSRAGWPLPNVWHLASASTQAEVESQWADLAQTPAAVRGLSLEPLLERIDLAGGDGGDDLLGDGEWRGTIDGAPLCPEGDIPPGIDWVIAGCESGPGRRPMDEDHVRQLRDQCVGAGVPFFFKQTERDGKIVSMPPLDGRVWAQMPRTVRP